MDRIRPKASAVELVPDGAGAAVAIPASPGTAWRARLLQPHPPVDLLFRNAAPTYVRPPTLRRPAVGYTPGGYVLHGAVAKNICIPVSTGRRDQPEDTVQRELFKPTHTELMAPNPFHAGPLCDVVT